MSSLIVRNAATASLGGSRCRTRVGLPRPCLPTPAARTRLSCGDMISACSQPPLMAAKRLPGVSCRSSSSGDAQSSGSGGDDNNLAYTLGMGLLWAALLGYALLLAPNQTPYRDDIFLRLLVGMREADEDFVVNQVFTSLFNIMGVYPGVFACLLIPGGRSGNKLPAWPFVAASFFLGVFALLPYFTFWKPDKEQKLPPPREELEGWQRVYMKAGEGLILPGLLAAAAAAQLYFAATAGGAAWADYWKLFEESRFVHVTSIDFCCLTAFVPFWMYHDAEGRKWEQRDTLVPLLSLLPVLGPAIYLVLRPKTAAASPCDGGAPTA